MPDIKRLGTLVDRLRELSKENKVPWMETPEDGVFQASLKGGLVTIADEAAGYPYGEQIFRYAIRFFDTSGTLLDRATVSDFPENYKFAGGKSPFEALSELHDQARRKALKVEEALDELLKSL